MFGIAEIVPGAFKNIVNSISLFAVAILTAATV